MEQNHEITLLKESFLEFVNKILPVLTEPILDQFNTKWIPLKQLLLDPSKNGGDIFILVSTMSSLKKSTTSSTSATSPNSDCSIQKSNRKEQTIQKRNEPSEQREITKVKEQANPLYHRELRIEINKNFFLNTPRSKPNSSQDLNHMDSKEDIKTKIIRDDIKSLNQLKIASLEKRISVTVKCNLSSKLSDAIFQFRKNSMILKTVHERSCEVTTPKSPKKDRSESPLLVIHRPQHQFFQHQQGGALKGYSIYSKNGILQPVQFDTQFQMMMQQYQNNLIYKKLYF